MELKSESTSPKVSKTSIGFKTMVAVYNNSIVLFTLLTRTPDPLRVFAVAHAKRYEPVRI